MNRFILAFGISLSVAVILGAQEVPKFTFNIGGGFTQPVGITNNHLNMGWNIQGGVGYNFSSRLGANIDLGFNDMGIDSTTLANIGVPGGSVHIFSATLDPIVHLNPRR